MISTVRERSPCSLLPGGPFGWLLAGGRPRGVLLGDQPLDPLCQHPVAILSGIGPALARYQGPGVLSICPAGEVGPDGMGLVWSRHEPPGSCGSHSLMTPVEARACRPIILDPSRPDCIAPG
jgi:hypothetical protein